MARGAMRARVVELLGDVAVDGSLSYGTAGFRARAERLRGALVRVGVLAALRSIAARGAVTGVMVTASHNPPADNGAKIVDPSGAMLARDWENAAAAFVNASDLAAALDALCVRLALDLDALADTPASVVVGADTRPSSRELVQCVARGVRAVCHNGVLDLGMVTTPQLHFTVRANFRGERGGLDAYYLNLRREYSAMCARSAPLACPLICLDCANGVGAIAMRGLDCLVPQLVTYNHPEEGDLNRECGADFVQKRRLMPIVYGEPRQTDLREQLDFAAPALWASLDGDADRLVLYKEGPPSSDPARKSVILADGDRFSVLVANFLSKHLGIANISDITIGVAQTAYSNGAATAYLESLSNVKVVIAKTGVKHLEIAVDPFDIGIYWEPNGHGTVLYSDKISERLKSMLASLGPEESPVADSLKALKSVGLLANQAIGDGLADLLLVLAILSQQGMSFEDWITMYDERCSANRVVRVADKNVIETADCDREVVKPVQLRDAVSNIASGCERRAFVRPSGTEDVVRVYAEAPAGCQQDADDMALSIARAVYDTCGGVGDRP